MPSFRVSIQYAASANTYFGKRFFSQHPKECSKRRLGWKSNIYQGRLKVFRRPLPRIRDNNCFTLWNFYVHKAIFCIVNFVIYI